MKYLEMTCSDGSVWRIPAEFIAKNRATYYAEKDKDTTYDAEFAYTMGSRFELADWAVNNMNWSDVEGVAVKVADGTRDMQEEWNCAEKEVVTV